MCGCSVLARHRCCPSIKRLSNIVPALRRVVCVPGHEQTTWCDLCACLYHPHLSNPHFFLLPRISPCCALTCLLLNVAYTHTYTHGWLEKTQMCLPQGWAWLPMAGGHLTGHLMSLCFSSYTPLPPLLFILPLYQMILLTSLDFVLMVVCIPELLLCCLFCGRTWLFPLPSLHTYTQHGHALLSPF